jgi:hypothetical protein
MRSLALSAPLGLDPNTSNAPNIRTRAPSGSENDFRTAVLPGLDVVCELMLCPGRLEITSVSVCITKKMISFQVFLLTISQVGDLDSYWL